jgi:hypothetical protein
VNFKICVPTVILVRDNCERQEWLQYCTFEVKLVSTHCQKVTLNSVIYNDAAVLPLRVVLCGALYIHWMDVTNCNIALLQRQQSEYIYAVQCCASGSEIMRKLGSRADFGSGSKLSSVSN